MAHGTPKGVVDDKFKDRIKDLEDYARSCAEQIKTWSEPRKWATPEKMKDRDLLDVPSLHDPCWDRNNINRIYSEQILNDYGDKGGTVGDLIAMKWQADFMAVEERAFRLRHASMARCMAVAHGRLDGHGITEHGIFSYLRRTVQAYIDTGRANTAPDPKDDYA
jgi:hypothetical protein